MRIKRSYIFAGAILGAVVGFFALSAVFGAKSKPAEAATSKGVQTQAVQVNLIAPTLRAYDVTIRGRTEAPRTVQVRSETSGLVAETPTVKGSWVHAGQVLCRLAVDARQASLDQAQAKLRSMDLTYQANQKLAAKGFRSETQVLAAKADLDQASAAVRSAQVAIRQIDIKAPFAGVFDTRDVEVGGYLAPGQSCGTVVELDPILIVGDVPEADASKLTVGEPASAKLTTGGVLTGRVRYVAHEADPQTRTYHVEVVAPNPGHDFRAGLSGEISIKAGQGSAHLVPTSALVLDTNGRQGVRYVTANNQVAFAPVRTLEETADGVWVAGLDGPVRIITVGQSYVSEGQTVRVSQR
ncbi:MAG TPA: efflux RND transporter periplasmic adaptor subunit [Caulobacteraceae bacterium]|jgi:multidrug efflux system membrane fusion protein